MLRQRVENQSRKPALDRYLRRPARVTTTRYCGSRDGRTRVKRLSYGRTSRSIRITLLQKLRLETKLFFN